MSHHTAHLILRTGYFSVVFGCNVSHHRCSHQNLFYSSFATQLNAHDTTHCEPESTNMSSYTTPIKKRGMRAQRTQMVYARMILFHPETIQRNMLQSGFRCNAQCSKARFLDLCPPPPILFWVDSVYNLKVKTVKKNLLWTSENVCCKIVCDKKYGHYAILHLGQQQWDQVVKHYSQSKQWPLR